MKKVAIYDPYLDTLGGGEKHILSIAEVLAAKGYEINIFWDNDMRSELMNRFPLAHIKDYRFRPNIFKKSDTLLTLKTLSDFEFFFYVTDGSYFASSAKKNFVFAMVPEKKLYSMNLVNRLKLWNYKFISNSPYTSRWLTRWGISPITIMPYLSNDILKTKTVKKDKIILSVARFFPHLHSKNHALLIEVFQKLKTAVASFKEYRLILAGGLKEEDRDYFSGLKEKAGNDKSILLKPNVSNDELIKLYRESKYFWHFTGFGVDEGKHPEMVEHFGIAPLEAMATGCITFCHNSGGPKFFIEDGKTGHFFSTQEELIAKMSKSENSEIAGMGLANKAMEFAKKRYNYEKFSDTIIRSLL